MLHCDISAGNILVDKVNHTGTLIDLDLATLLDITRDPAMINSCCISRHIGCYSVCCSSDIHI